MSEFAAWAAGFFDGEGMVHAHHPTAKGRRGLQVALRIAQTVREPLDAIQQAYGGHIVGNAPRNPRHRYQWSLHLHGPDAIRFLEATLPYLRVKQVIAEAGLALLYTLGPKGKRTPPDVIERRCELAAIIRAANRASRSAA